VRAFSCAPLRASVDVYFNFVRPLLAVSSARFGSIAPSSGRFREGAVQSLVGHNRKLRRVQQSGLSTVLSTHSGLRHFFLSDPAACCDREALYMLRARMALIVLLNSWAC